VLKKNFLICLVGLPASGKSTFAKNFKRFLEREQENYEVKVIDPDIIRKSLTPDEFDYQQEQLVRKKNLEQIKTNLNDGFIVISDDLNYYSSMRHDLKLITEELNLNFFIIHISTPLEICLQWNEKRGKIIPNSVIKKIAHKFDNFDKYKWDSPIASINLSEVKDFNHFFENLMNKITYEMENLYEQQKKEGIFKQSTDLYNEMLDKTTRKIVGEILKNSEFKPLKNQILKFRKLYVKLNRNKFLNQSLITSNFKEYLEKNLNIEIA
jgi:tRNA uridine 5-carbamoylmethylation protein Kti12